MRTGLGVSLGGRGQVWAYFGKSQQRCMGLDGTYSLFNVDQLHMLVQLLTEHILVKKEMLLHIDKKAQIQTLIKNISKINK